MDERVAVSASYSLSVWSCSVHFPLVSLLEPMNGVKLSWNCFLACRAHCRHIVLLDEAAKFGVEGQGGLLFHICPSLSNWILFACPQTQWWSTHSWCVKSSVCSELSPQPQHGGFRWRSVRSWLLVQPVERARHHRVICGEPFKAGCGKQGGSELSPIPGAFGCLFWGCTLDITGIGAHTSLITTAKQAKLSSFRAELPED